MDPVKQAKAICNHGVSVTALQQQLAELKGKASGLESILRSGIPSASPCFPELAPIRTHATSTTGADCSQQSETVGVEIDCGISDLLESDCARQRHLFPVDSCDGGLCICMLQSTKVAQGMMCKPACNTMSLWQQGQTQCHRQLHLSQHALQLTCSFSNRSNCACCCLSAAAQATAAHTSTNPEQLTLTATE